MNRLGVLLLLLTCCPTTACGQNRNCICPEWEFGSSSNMNCGAGGTSPCGLFYASKHTGPDCYTAEYVVYETVTGAYGFCAPPDRCTDCGDLGGASAKEKGATRKHKTAGTTKKQDSAKCGGCGSTAILTVAPQSTQTKSFTTISLPIAADYDYDAPNDGVVRSKSQVTPHPHRPAYVLKVGTDKYVRIYTYLHSRTDSKNSHIVTFGLECKKPEAGAIPFTGRIARVKVWRSIDMKPAAQDLNNHEQLLRFMLGGEVLFVRVKDASLWP